MHTLFDYEGNLPAYVNITNGKGPLIPRSVIVADAFYNDFSLLNVWDSNKVFFVIRHKENLQFIKIKENSLPENRHEHILVDEIIELANKPSKKKYPKKLRRVVVWDEKNQNIIELITN